jgi:hypothetical protein
LLMIVVLLCQHFTRVTGLVLFERQQYDVTILSSTPVGTEVLRVSISSSASVSYLLFSYTISGGSVVAALPFHLDPSTGAVTVASPLEYETSYEFATGVREISNNNLIAPTAARVRISVTRRKSNRCLDSLRPASLFVCHSLVWLSHYSHHYHYHHHHHNSRTLLTVRVSWLDSRSVWRELR